MKTQSIMQYNSILINSYNTMIEHYDKKIRELEINPQYNSSSKSEEFKGIKNKYLKCLETALAKLEESNVD